MDSTPVIMTPEFGFTPLIASENMLPLVFYLVVGFYVILTGVLYYHWNAYNNNKLVAAATELAYLAITVPLLLVMVTSALIL